MHRCSQARHKFTHVRNPWALRELSLRENSPSRDPVRKTSYEYRGFFVGGLCTRVAGTQAA